MAARGSSDPMIRSRCCVFPTVLLLLATWIAVCGGRGTGRINFDRFFCSVDRDGDGEIEQHEATKFLSEMDVTAVLKDDEAVKHPHFEEFSYGGKSISSEEMRDHLQNMLTADMVVNWITHGLQLPQYADAFRKNAINGLDFLSLIENDSWALAEELGVTSSLHRTKITGAIVRQIFGYGVPPGASQVLRCQPSSCGGIQLNWEPPKGCGYPPLHKYLVFRWSGAASAWILVTDTKETSFFDSGELFLGKAYSYRIQAWGGHGPSEWVTVTNCTASAPSVSFQNIAANNAVVAIKTTAMNSEGSQVDDETEGSKGMEVTPWGWIGSVNGGVFLLGILSRQSFFFRVTLAAWVIFRKFVKRVTLRIYATQTSDKIWLRTLSRGFVSLCRGWMCVQRKILVLSRQACVKEKPILTHSGSLIDSSSTPDCAIEEMFQNATLTEIKKLRMSHDLDERSKSFPDVTVSSDDTSESSSSPLEDRCLSSPATFDDSRVTNSSYAREQELSIHRKRTRHRCNHEGCKTRFDRWGSINDWISRFSKHYCRECQRVFCVRHTRISPHGPNGRCGLDSTCVCLSCFNNLSLEVQERLERINKLRVGPPVVSADSSRGSSDNRDPFPPDFSAAKSFYVNRDPSSTGSLS